MDDKRGVCVSGFCSPHGNIQQKPWDEFCWEVRMSMLIFFPLLRRLSHSGPGPLPPWSPCFQSKKSFCFQSSSPRNQTLRNIFASGCSVDRETQHLGAVLISSKRGRGLPCELFRVATLARCQSSSLIVMPVF